MRGLQKQVEISSADYPSKNSPDDVRLKRLRTLGPEDTYTVRRRCGPEDPENDGTLRLRALRARGPVLWVRCLHVLAD